MSEKLFEEDALDAVVARRGGTLIVPDMGIMEALGDPISLLLDNEDVALDEVVERKGGKLILVNTGFIIGEAVL